MTEEVTEPDRAAFFVDAVRAISGGRVQRYSAFIEINKPVVFGPALAEEMTNRLRIMMDEACFEFGTMPHINRVSLLRP